MNVSEIIHAPLSALLLNPYNPIFYDGVHSVFFKPDLMRQAFCLFKRLPVSRQPRKKSFRKAFCHFYATQSDGFVQVWAGLFFMV